MAILVLSRLRQLSSIMRHINSQIALNLRAAVVDEAVGGSVGSTGDNLDAVLSNISAESIDALSLSEEVGGDASNVGRGHGGAAQLLSGTSRDGRQNINAGSENVHKLAKVGELRDLIILASRANGASLGRRSRRRRSCIGCLIAGGDGEEDTCVDDSISGIVDALGERTAQAHVDNRAAFAALARWGILDDVLHALDNARVGARAIVSEDLDGVELGLLSNTVGLAANGSGTVGTVALTIALVVVG